MLRYQSSQNVVKVIAQLKKREQALKHQRDLERTAYASWGLIQSNPGEAATGSKALHDKRIAGQAALHAIDTFTREMERSREKAHGRLWQPKHVNAARHRHEVASEAEAQRTLAEAAETIPLIPDDAHVRSSTEAYRAKSARRTRPRVVVSASEPRLLTRELLLDHAHAPTRELIKLRELLRASGSSGSGEQSDELPLVPTTLKRPQTANASRVPNGQRVRYSSQQGDVLDEVRLPPRYNLAKIRAELNEDLEWLQRAATHPRKP